jgi:SSS family solute:Na+ symporter
LLLGWAVGIGVGTWMAVSLKLASSIYTVHLFGYAVPGYAAVWALVVNLVVSIVVSVLVRMIGLTRSHDHTKPEDYLDVVEN